MRIHGTTLPIGGWYKIVIYLESQTDNFLLTKQLRATSITLLHYYIECSFLKTRIVALIFL